MSWVPSESVGEEEVDDLPPLLYFYYGWYGGGKDGKNWRYGITDEPQAGYYDSHDLANARHQFAMIRDTGGTGVVHSWWGIGSHDDTSLDVAVEAAELEDIKITASFEAWAYEFRESSATKHADQLRYVWTEYAQSPAWLQQDGKPVLFLHAAGIHGADHWERVLDILADEGIEFYTYAEVRDVEQMEVLRVLDAAYFYMPVELQRDRSYANANREMQEVADSYGKEWVPTVAPGYDNSNDSIKRHHLVVDDEDGQLFREAWENATRMDADMILIGTWNEWNEGTTIEPGVEDGGRRLQLVVDLIREHKERLAA